MTRFFLYGWILLIFKMTITNSNSKEKANSQLQIYQNFSPSGSTVKILVSYF